jgi:hypothetical protein
VAHHFAGLADIAELLGELQQANLMQLMTRQPSGQASVLVEFLIRRSQVRILLLHERRELVEVL